MRRFYFKPGERRPTGRLPRQAVIDCSHVGACDNDVSHWVSVLRFDVDPELARAYLRGVGAWDTDDLQDHAVNVERVFWILCCNRHEDPRAPLYLGE